MTQQPLSCFEKKASGSDKGTDNVVEDDIAAVVVVGGSEAPEQQEEFEEAPGGDQAGAACWLQEQEDEQVQGEANWEDYKVPGWRKQGKRVGPSSVSYLSQERQASESQTCREVVAMVAGRRRHKRTQGREAIEGEEYFEE